MGLLSYAQEQIECGLLYYGEKTIKLNAPEGWVLDCEAGLVSHIRLVMYPEGTTWQNAETAMHIDFESLEMGQDGFEELISDFDSQFKAKYKGIKIKKRKTIKIRNYDGIVKYLGGGDYPNYEYLAYIDVDTFVITMTVSSRSKKNLKASYSDFMKVLNSIQILELKSNHKK